MSDQPPVERHAAVDRFGKTSLRTAHGLTAALVEQGLAAEDEPVVVRTGGPHRSLDGLAALLDAALEDAAGSDATAGEEPTDDVPTAPAAEE
jgi:hypothetical protein